MINRHLYTIYTDYSMQCNAITKMLFVSKSEVEVESFNNNFFVQNSMYIVIQVAQDSLLSNERV
jgi:hypothetical protein